MHLSLTVRCRLFPRILETHDQAGTAGWQTSHDALTQLTYSYVDMIALPQELFPCLYICNIHWFRNGKAPAREAPFTAFQHHKYHVWLTVFINMLPVDTLHGFSIMVVFYAAFHILTVPQLLATKTTPRGSQEDTVATTASPQKDLLSPRARHRLRCSRLCSKP